jgi:hypothetical protein
MERQTKDNGVNFVVREDMGSYVSALIWAKQTLNLHSTDFVRVEYTSTLGAFGERALPKPPPLTLGVVFDAALPKTNTVQYAETVSNRSSNTKSFRKVLCAHIKSFHFM